MFYRHLLRPLTFAATRHDPELAHHAALTLLASISRSPPILRRLQRTLALTHPALQRTIAGIAFPNPVGLAAGYDKDGTALPALAALGFGHIEVGTVTWHAQPGNPRPRLFRLPHSHALINRMGFNNAGALALREQLQATSPLPLPLGISIGKSRRTPLEHALADYRASYIALAPYADYIAINVSSPNTPGLRNLQARDQLEQLLSALHTAAHQPVPLFVKLAPDLAEHDLLDLLDVCLHHHVAAVIATNTTLSRDNLHPADQHLAHQAGGLSGAPLTARALQMVQFIVRETGGTLPVVGVGGILSPNDALHMLDAGATLIQLYTGLIYHGPLLVSEINRALLERIPR